MNVWYSGIKNLVKSEIKAEKCSKNSVFSTKITFTKNNATSYMSGRSQAGLTLHPNCILMRLRGIYLAFGEIFANFAL